MFRDIQIVVDPPPIGVFTFEDTVTGKVLFETKHEEKIAWVSVFFHGWANTHVIHQTNQGASQSGPGAANYKDKDVLFQTSKKVYEGHERLAKNVRYEWPFQFDFRAEMQDAASLPSSGKYGNGSVEYKLIAIPGNAAMDENYIQGIMNPELQNFQKEAPFSPTSLYMFAAKHVGGAAEKELQFVKIRPETTVNGHLLGPFASIHEIGAHHLPEIEGGNQERHGFLSRQPQVPFEVDLQMPQNIIDGAYFPLFLSLTSRAMAWTEKPPPATLVSLQIHLHIKTIERASIQSNDHIQKLLLFEAKDLNISLGFKPVDLSHVFPIRVFGQGVVPSFDTRLLTRKYDLLVEATVKVAGKSFQARFLDNNHIELLSSHVAVGRPPAAKPESQTKKKIIYQLKHSYIGRFIQQDNGPIREDIIMEAAIAFSRALTKFEVPHEFPGGSLVKILPYRFDRVRTNTSNFDKVTDSEKIHAMFDEDRHFDRVPVWESDMKRCAMDLRFTDLVHGQNIMVNFPTLLIQTDDQQHQYIKQSRGPMDAVKIDPVSLFNYRLSCAINREKLELEEISDFDGLHRAFHKELHSHRKHISVNSARLAVERYPELREVVEATGVDMGKGKETGAARPEENKRDPGYEVDLVKGMKKHLFFHRKH